MFGLPDMSKLCGKTGFIFFLVFLVFTYLFYNAYCMNQRIKIIEADVGNLNTYMAKVIIALNQENKKPDESNATENDSISDIELSDSYKDPIEDQKKYTKGNAFMRDISDAMKPS